MKLALDVPQPIGMVERMPEAEQEQTLGIGVGRAYIFLGERLVMVQWIGTIIILAAVFGIMRLPKTEIVSAQ